MARLYDPMRAREHYIILGVGKTGENGVISWCNWVVEHPVEHNVPRSFCNVPRTFVEQSKIVNALIYIVEHPWNICGALLHEMLRSVQSVYVRLQSV